MNASSCLKIVDTLRRRPRKWCFNFYGETPLKLVRGRERIYFELADEKASGHFRIGQARTVAGNRAERHYQQVGSLADGRGARADYVGARAVHQYSGGSTLIGGELDGKTKECDANGERSDAHG
jgi:hypothetical protein